MSLSKRKGKPRKYFTPRNTGGEGLAMFTFALLERLLQLLENSLWEGLSRFRESVMW